MASSENNAILRNGRPLILGEFNVFPSFLHSVYRSATSAVLRMDTQHWAIVGVCVVVIGFFCMRGYGSRDNY